MRTDDQPDTLAFARNCIAFLRQGSDLLIQISDAQYVASMPPVYASTVGAHIRHILDHFRCLLDGLQSGLVNYDQRGRCYEVETKRHTAIAELEQVVRELQGLDTTARDVALRVKMDCGGQQVNDWTRSSAARELQFLTSHTIHHYALVAAILDHAGCRPDPTFGISPSTLSYEKRRQAQAR